MTTTDDNRQPGRIQRFIRNRIAYPKGMNDQGGIRSEVGKAMSALRPARLDPAEARAAINGRYKDGGREKFARMVEAQHLSDAQLQLLAANHRRTGLLYKIAGFGFIALGLWVGAQGMSGAMRNGAATAGVSILFFGLGFRADFSAWQIASRRFGSIREFFRGAEH